MNKNIRKYLAIGGFGILGIANLSENNDIYGYINKNEIDYLKKEHINNLYENRNDILINLDGEKINLIDALNKKGINMYLSPIENNNNENLILVNGYGNEKNNKKLSLLNNLYYLKYYDAIKKTLRTKDETSDEIQGYSVKATNVIHMLKNVDLKGEIENDIEQLMVYFHELGHLHYMKYYEKNTQEFNKEKFLAESFSDLYSYFSIMKYYATINSDNYENIREYINEYIELDSEKIINALNKGQNIFQVYNNYFLKKLAIDISLNIEFTEINDNDIVAMSQDINDAFIATIEDENNHEDQYIIDINKNAKEVYSLISEVFIKKIIELQEENNELYSKNKKIKKDKKKYESF